MHHCSNDDQQWLALSLLMPHSTPTTNMHQVQLSPNDDIGTHHDENAIKNLPALLSTPQVDLAALCSKILNLPPLD